MKQNTSNIGMLLQNSIFMEAESKKPSKATFGDDLQVSLLRGKSDKKARPRRQKMPRLIDDERRKLLMKFCAVLAVMVAAGYGMYKGTQYADKKLGEARYTRFIRSVSDGKAVAEGLYAARDTKVKMVSYELGESQKDGRGMFAKYRSPLIMDYDTTGNGQADLRVYRTVDPEIFGGWEEGDVANETHGSWKRYSHPLDDVLQETRQGNGSILDLNSGKMVKFGRQGR